VRVHNTTSTNTAVLRTTGSSTVYHKKLY
jgi:hypothetical protein